MNTLRYWLLAPLTYALNFSYHRVDHITDHRRSEFFWNGPLLGTLLAGILCAYMLYRSFRIMKRAARNAGTLRISPSLRLRYWPLLLFLPILLHNYSGSIFSLPNGGEREVVSGFGNEYSKVYFLAVAGTLLVHQLYRWLEANNPATTSNPAQVAAEP